MTFPGRTLLAAATLATWACTAPDPLLTFLDEESGLSLTHPPRWTIGSAEQAGVRYRYLTAPKIGDDKEALSVTLISPVAAASADTVAAAYLTGAFGVVMMPGPGGAVTWTFKDQAGVTSTLYVAPAGQGRYMGAWARGSDAAMKHYQGRIGGILNSLRLESVPEWPEERLAGMAVRAPAAWTRGSRLSNATNASMQFKSPPLIVDKGTDTIHGFVTLTKEPVPAPGDLEAFYKVIRNRVSDTVARLDRATWEETPDLVRPPGYADYLRSGTPVSSTRIRRWITARDGVGLMLTCEARSDAFDRVDPWCRRMAQTVRFE
ncbi:MAG: hypothetical protein K1Y01_00805 [Vicinamibacteria bacterium]|nr:hypothetical protein [Vicinamibacteria bacterium]